ncbi:uncharacterized protein LOC122519152 isoform X2 [Polistes fuscatus]|uniref:uncharacterized protein LOC122519152 isoform X2 n=1 Tax=Polistes fuscatus TaxID=30207 RepID=UPI001CA9043A|nr:uncharacterized protein LOC122519152 isoform X2 [Polistes fuscatus]
MDEKSSDNVISAQKSLPSSYDSGWNDTPKWASPYAANTNISTKRILNKRVPFPLISGELMKNNNECQSSTAGMPLPPPSIPPLENKIDEVQKRLDVMKSCWLDNKLNDSIQQKILDISKALKEEDVDKADKLHIALMIDHTSLCSAWIPSIRHIISALKRRKSCPNDL